MSVPLTMEAVIKTVTTLPALTTVPVTLDSYWMMMAMVALVSTTSSTKQLLALHDLIWFQLSVDCDKSHYVCLEC